MNLILFGFKGCGKTHFGRLLANHLQRPFFDTDEIVASRYPGLTCRGIYRQMGETAFRRAEKEAIISLSGAQDAVIAVGGGAVIDPENVRLLQQIGRLIYLDARLETIRNRVADFAVGLPDEIYRERKPIYESIPALCVGIDEMNEAEALEQIKETYGV